MGCGGLGGRTGRAQVARGTLRGCSVSGGPEARARAPVPTSLGRLTLTALLKLEGTPAQWQEQALPTHPTPAIHWHGFCGLSQHAANLASRCGADLLWTASSLGRQGCSGGWDAGHLQVGLRLADSPRPWPCPCAQAPQCCARHAPHNPAPQLPQLDTRPARPWELTGCTSSSP